ncbi:putative VHS domain, ENTH domain, AP-4 complex accessory subunit Tepsin [Helianthus annuus]|nr:putative VHS domain, ENTH domain, AP-4 complex accessory subunit Tepsin [Helianthus annuus]
MDKSRRAVESYWRSKTIDDATSDEDKVTPVYKLDEICELLRSSHVSIVKEVSQFIFKRLQHKSPLLNRRYIYQFAPALRVIKYAVGKSGADFKREMQRNSAAIRELIHHRGHPDPLKGDALNKSVRETAQEALSALFSGEDTSKPPPNEGLAQRIQGFGNTNFDPPSNDKKSFLNEVVGIGSATIKQGLNNLTQTQTPNKNNNTGTYKSANLSRSFTSFTNENSYSGSLPSARLSTEVSGPWGQEVKTSQMDNSSGGSGSGSHYVGVKSREERLLETIVTSGGIRLQPTRDALQVFLTEASKLDAFALSQALEAKLQSHMWQVCVRGLCVLEAILRKKDEEHFHVVASYFTENIDVVVKCSQSPQASAREKANKVLSLLMGEQTGSRMSQQDKKTETEIPKIQMPDLIDTNDPNGNENENNVPVSSSTTSLMDDFFGDSGLATVDKSSETQPELFDLFGSKDNVNDLMSGLSINENASSPSQDGPAKKESLETAFSDSSHSTTNLNPQMNDVLSNMLQFQGHGMNPNPMMLNPMDPSTYNTMMLNPMLFGSQQINYAAMSNLLAQQQFLSTMNNLQSQNLGPASSSSAFPDIFNPVIATQPPTSTMNTSKKDDTKAFDFISDHLAAARDPKRVN